MNRSHTDILDSQVKIPEHTVLRRFAAETVAFDLRTGKYHGLDPAAGHMLDVLARSSGVRSAAETLAAYYGRPFEETAANLCELCANLDARGLIALSTSA